MQAGDTLLLSIAVTKNGAPLDLTGATLYMTAKVAITDADPGFFQLTSTPAAGITITNAVGGLAEAEVTPALTISLAGTAATYLYYDVKVKESTGEVTTVELGQLKVFYTVTRNTP